MPHFTRHYTSSLIIIIYLSLVDSVQRNFRGMYRAGYIHQNGREPNRCYGHYMDWANYNNVPVVSFIAGTELITYGIMSYSLIALVADNTHAFLETNSTCYFQCVNTI